MVQMKKKIFWSLLLLVAMLLSGCARTTEIRFGTADIGGTYYAYGSALAQLTGSEDVRFDIKNTAGSAAAAVGRISADGHRPVRHD